MHSRWDLESEKFEILEGKTLTRVFEDGDELIFIDNSGNAYKLYHDQNCCESVSIDDICGDLSDLVGVPILKAEVTDSVGGFDSGKSKHDGDDSYTWTFYRITTFKGTVTIRWYGASNGYYSEHVDFAKIKGGYYA